MATNKTPVMVLQEIAVKLNQTLEFQLVYEQTNTSLSPLFKYAVSFNNLRAISEGRSKKQAKHNAAKSILEKLGKQGMYRSPEGNLPDQASKSPEKSVFQVNAIGVLSELCVEMNIPQPLYSEVADVGPPHAREFTYACQVGHIKITATSTTKKRAKQDVANRMLHRLNDSLSEVTDVAAHLDMPALPPCEEHIDAAIANFTKLTTCAQKPKNKSRLIRDDSLVLKNIRIEKGITVDELNEMYFTKERNKNNLIDLLNYLDIKASINTEPGKTNFISMVYLELDPELAFIGCGTDEKISEQDVIINTFSSLELLLK